MAKCNKCGVSIPMMCSLCETCAEKAEAEATTNFQDSRSPQFKEVQAGEVSSYPPLSILLFILAGLSMLGGMILCGQLWPGDPGYGMEWQTAAYLPGLTALTVGLIQFALYTAVGLGLAYLKQIVINTEHKIA
tara:strand:+ start:1209 stop:1607 length:399 start_codon:yes stop_codon:yes gene_type:complete